MSVYEIIYEDAEDKESCDFQQFFTAAWLAAKCLNSIKFNFLLGFYGSNRYSR
jgi:hypothetical protein